MTQANSLAGKPLTPAMIKPRSKPAQPTGADLPVLVAAVAETLGALLAEYTSSPFRAEADGISPEKREIPVPGAEGVRLTSPRGMLNPLVVADRSFIMGLCESGFGGSGTEPPHDAGERPLSRTEARVTKAVLQELCAKLPAMLGECFKTEFQVVTEEGRRSPPPAQPVTAAFEAGRVLIHFFGYSGEILLLLPEAEVAALVAHIAKEASPAGAGEDQQAQFRAAVLESAIAVIAQLPQELMPLGEVAQLRKGQLLKFKATAHTPFQITSDGVVLHMARLAPAEDRLTLEIIAD